jgi:hypothetical protein
MCDWHLSIIRLYLYSLLPDIINLGRFNVNTMYCYYYYY